MSSESRVVATIMIIDLQTVFVICEIWGCHIDDEFSNLVGNYVVSTEK
jgi:hypothetical protein